LFTTRIWLSLLIYPMAAAVLFGAAVLPIMLVPWLDERAADFFPVAVAISVLGAAPIAWHLGGRIRKKER